jgi:hypothetical protein
MFKSIKGAASLALVAASLYAGSASAQSLPSSLSIPIPGLLTISLSGLPTSPILSLNLLTTLDVQPIVGITLLGKPLANVALGPVAAVPEPETFAMMGLGLALVGFAARRRKSV